MQTNTVRRRWLTALRVTAIRGGLCAQLLLPLVVAGGQGSGPITLRLKFKPGETTKYSMTMKGTIIMPQEQGKPKTMPISGEGVMEWKVIRALPDGGGEVMTSLSQQNPLGLQPGVTQKIPPMTMILDARGNLKSMKGNPRGGPRGILMSGVFSNLGTPGIGAFLPEKAVKPGDTWTWPYRIRIGSAIARSTFVRVETIAGIKTARIRTTIRLPIRWMKDQTGKETTQSANAVMTRTGIMHLTIDTNFAIAEGKIVRSRGSDKHSMTTTVTRTGGAIPPGMLGKHNNSATIVMDMTILR